MSFISGLKKSDFVEGKTTYAGTSYPGSTVVDFAVFYIMLLND